MRADLALAALSLLLPACTVGISQHSAWHQKSAAGLVSHTATEAFELQCPEAATAVRLHLEVHGSDGELRLQVTDPSDQVCYDNSVRGGDHEQTLRWPARAGVWRCEFDLRDFSGSYGVELAAHDEPVLLNITVTDIEFHASK